MANLASVAKRARQAEKRRLRNAPLRARMRSIKKKLAIVLSAGNMDEIKTFIPEALRTFDKMVSKNIIRKQTAARYKTRVMAKVIAIDSTFSLPKITGPAEVKPVKAVKAPVKEAPVKKAEAKKAPAKKKEVKKED